MSDGAGWLIAIRRYLVAIAVGNLFWEIGQLPLYTLWATGTAGQIIFAVIHCTIGDVLIAMVALMLALVLVATPSWPSVRTRRVTAVTVIFGLIYTIYSEHLNTTLRANWAYGEMMPIIPWIGTGLSPFAQWLVIPPLAMWWGLQAGRPETNL